MAGDEKKVINLSLGVDVFRCVFLVLMLYWQSSAYMLYTIGLEQAIALPWGLMLLICDLLSKRRIIELKHKCLLYAFLALYVATMIARSEYISANLHLFLSLVIYLFVLCPPDYTAPIEGKYKAMFVFFTIFIVPVTIMSAISLWAQVTQRDLYINGFWVSYIRGGTRLKGIFRNANIAGALPFVSIAMLATDAVLIKKVFTRRLAIYASRAIIIASIVLNFAMLTMSGTTAARLSLVLFALSFAFILLFRVFSKRLRSVAISIISAAFIATCLSGATFLADRPIRIGVATVQATATKNVTSAAKNMVAEGQAADAYETEPTPLPITTRKNFFSQERLGLPFIGFEIIKKAPILGISQGGVAHEMLKFEERAEEFGMSESSLHAIAIGGQLHNSYLQLAAANGIPALVLMLLFLSLSAVRCLKRLFAGHRSMDSDTYFIIAGATSLCAALAFWNSMEFFLFSMNAHTNVVFWSCLSYADTFLKEQ